MEVKKVNFDVVKAVLIMMVVLDHNNYVREYFYGFFLTLNFHVIGFLVLPFLRQPQRISVDYFLNRFARYYIPFLTFYFIAFIIYNYFVNSSPGNIFDFLLAAYSGDPRLLKEVAGFTMLWFLPTLFGVVILLAFLESVPVKLKMVIMAALAVSHGLIGMVEKTFLVYLPFGASVVIYIFLLGALFRKLYCYVDRIWFLLLSVIVFIGSSYLLLVWGVPVEVGKTQVANCLDIKQLIFQAITGLFGVLSVVAASSWMSGMKSLTLIGRHSLLIYLVHPFIYYALDLLISRSPASYELSQWAYMIITFCTALLLSCWFSVVIYKITWLKNTISPGYWKDWTPVYFVKNL